MINYLTPSNFITIFVIIYGLSISDVTLTIKTIKKLKKIKPDSNPHDFEFNPLPKYLWEKFGYKWGGITQLVINFMILFSILIFTYNYNHQLFFFSSGLAIGSLIVVNIVHYGNLKAIKEKEHE